MCLMKSAGQALYEKHGGLVFPGSESYVLPWSELPQESRDAWEANAVDFLEKQKLDEGSPE